MKTAAQGRTLSGGVLFITGVGNQLQSESEKA